MSFATFVDFALKAGVPSALGVFIVWYLLNKFIPAQQAMFRAEMESTRQTFRDALTSEQRAHGDLMDQMMSTVRDESRQTRSSLDRLNTTAQTLAEVVHKMSGVVGSLHAPPFSDGRSATGNR